MKKLLYLVLTISLTSGLIWGHSTSSKAASPSAAEFYENNVVTMLCGFNPGGAVTMVPGYWLATGQLLQAGQ